METVVHSRYTDGADNAYGDPTRTLQATDTYSVPVWPTGTSEPNDPGRVQVTSGLSVALPMGTVVDVRRDRFTVRGATWEVDGEPSDYRSPWTARGLVVVNLKRVEG